MPKALCGFDNIPNGAKGSELLTSWGPTLLVDVGFDPNYSTPPNSTSLPIPGVKGIDALVDTGASISCIDNLLASQLSLPIADRMAISGAHGKLKVENRSPVKFKSGVWERPMPDRKEWCGSRSKAIPDLPRPSLYRGRRIM